MKKYLKFLLIILSISILLNWYTFAQKSKHKSLLKEKTSLSFPVAGSDLLGDRYLKVEEFLKENPNYFSQKSLRKTAAWNFTIGSTKFWTAINFVTNSEYSVSSTCRAVGDNCYIFVADDVWGNSVDSSAVAAVVRDFDIQTPADPNKGIFQMDVDTFGNPPDVDSDPRIIILILDIKDGYSGNGGFIAGYFSPDNEVRGGGLAAEIYFMDANPINLKTSSGLDAALTTAAHEFQHMINWNYHRTTPEMTFINEGLSMVAEIVCGYGASMQSLYANEPNHYLFDWRSGDLNLALNDYARAQRFFLYLMEQFDVGILKHMVMDNRNLSLVGIPALSKILLQNYSTSLGQVFINWEIANGLNDINVNSAYGYSYQPLPLTTGSTYYNPNINLTSSTVQRLGAEYFTFISSKDLNITFTSTGSDFIVKALEIGSGSSKVVDVPVNQSFTEPDYPSIYNTIRFVVIDTNQTTSQQYQYQASGTPINSITELKWDDTEPTGYYPWSSNDTVCVTFEAFAGGRLDSIRIALRRAGTIKGGVWEFTGVQNPSPLGKQLAVPITASISTEAQIINSGGKYPYNIPYSNWSTVDLRSYSISTDKPFAVAFAIGRDPTIPGVMATDLKSSGPYHSYTYLQTSDQVSSPGWYYITTNNAGDTIAIYLIRAYVSLVTGIVEQDVELTPSSYSLSQNYPNPFNPSTKINFQIVKDGFVSLKVYDILGNEVRTLVNEYMSKGSYNTIFDAPGLASGIYFYKLHTDGYTAVKKLMLLK